MTYPPYYSYPYYAPPPPEPQPEPRAAPKRAMLIDCFALAIVVASFFAPSFREWIHSQSAYASAYEGDPGYYPAPRRRHCPKRQPTEYVDYSPRETYTEDPRWEEPGVTTIYRRGE